MNEQRDLAVVVNVEFGQCTMRTAELRSFVVGDIFKLNADAGSPLLIYADGKFIGRGKAVVVGDHYGICITEIIPPNER